jgi:hypothetical protein
LGAIQNKAIPFFPLSLSLSLSSGADREKEERDGGKRKIKRKEERRGWLYFESHPRPSLQKTHCYILITETRKIMNLILYYNFPPFRASVIKTHFSCRA